MWDEPLTPREDRRLVGLVGALHRADVDCELETPRPQTIRLAARTDPGPARFRLALRNRRLLQQPVTQLSLGRAYLQGDLDVEILGDGAQRETNAMAVFGVRSSLGSGMSARQAFGLATELAFAAPTSVNARAVARHYSLGDDFYLKFLDRELQLYSQCRWVDGAASLEDAARDKVAHMKATLGLRQGDRILDVGGGWGGLAEHCAEMGVHVTTLTLSEDSRRYIEARTQPVADRVDVRLEDVLDHRPGRPYDHVVIFGVVEHIPTYGRLCRALWSMMKPGGTLYLDASATTQKYAASAFARRYTWGGPHSCLAVQDLVGELLLHGFAVRSVTDDTDDYHRTLREWARRLDAEHHAIAADWGEHVYRSFRVFLWGGAQGMQDGRLQAYTVVAERGASQGPRPRPLRRAASFVASLR